MMVCFFLFFNFMLIFNLIIFSIILIGRLKETFENCTDFKHYLLAIENRWCIKSVYPALFIPLKWSQSSLLQFGRKKGSNYLGNHHNQRSFTINIGVELAQFILFSQRKCLRGHTDAASKVEF